MKNALRLVALTVLALGLLTGTASAQFSDPQDRISGINKLFDDPFPATHSDFAFWGKYAVLGYYTATTGGVHIYDISNPASPDEIRNFPCNGNQNDPILWDRNGNGAPDLMLLAVDRTMDGTACNAPVSMQGAARFDANPNGWEGVRVFELSDGSGDLRARRPVRGHQPGRLPVHGLRRTHHHREHEVRERCIQSAAGRVRVVVSAAAGADVRSDRPAGGPGAVQERQQPVRGRERP